VRLHRKARGFTLLELLLVVAVVVVLGGFLSGAGCATPRAKEPSYEGRSLTHWLNDYARTQYANDPEPWVPPWTDEDRAVRTRAENAVRHIGTNALPMLIKMVSSGYELEGYGPVAHLGFDALGATAKPAVPALVAMLDDERMAHEAAASLGAIGAAAEEAVPTLLGRSNPADGPPAIFAVQALAQIKMRPELVVPVFMDILATNRNPAGLAGPYIEALGSFGEQARPAVPVLLPFLASTADSVRVCTTNALKQIDLYLALKAGIR
jgi:prepilin-type N-terminal cleavage/methylation domain-containing protein